MRGRSELNGSQSWLKRHSVNFDTIKFIRNTHNNNNSINMCRELHEVDEFAANLLIDILENPDIAPNPRLNPFNPVGVIENLHQSCLNRFV